MIITINFIDNATTVLQTVSEHPQDINVTVNENTFRLSCRANGYPLPSIVWLHNGSVINDTADERISITVDESEPDRTVNSSLIILSSILTDSGNYHCDVIIDSIRSFSPVSSKTALVLVQG